MKKALASDLAKANGLTFARVADCREFVQRLHGLAAAARQQSDYGLLEKIYGWVFVPWSLWPVDIRGLGLHMIGCIEAGREVDAGARLMCGLLAEAPSDTVCRPIAEYEHAVKSGNYEGLIEAQHKFDLMERELAKNPQLKADWDGIKNEFKVDKYRNAAGIIRRRLAQERNFRPADWKFSWETEAQRFQNVFDAFCHRWDLFGMEEDRPLLLKLTANVTPYGTIIMVPRYWSFDPRRDLKWKAITRLHRTRSAQKQGVKLSSNEAERREEAERGRQFWQEATKAGLKGEKRKQWVMGRLGWDARTDDSRLRRVLKRERLKAKS
jgi:hypothetical protein